MLSSPQSAGEEGKCGVEDSKYIQREGKECKDDVLDMKDLQGMSTSRPAFISPLTTLASASSKADGEDYSHPPDCLPFTIETAAASTHTFIIHFMAATEK